MATDYITEIKGAIRGRYGCEATYLQTVGVKEVLQGRLIWAGEVECFVLQGVSPLRRCYAWIVPAEKDRERHVAIVLHVGSVDSPMKAVRSYFQAGGTG